MKPFIRLSFATFALLLFALTACNKNSSDNTPVSNSNNNNGNNSTAFMSGNFTITSYTQRTENKTAQFAGAVFTFSTNNTVTAAMNGTTTSGTWSHIPYSVGYYGGEPTKESISISLGTASPLDRLSKTWNVSSSSATQVVLVTPEPADDEHITFTKQ
mgnify:CR=1 FL=1